jgi:hypothetical protein
MKGRIVQIILISWMVVVLAAHGMLLGAPVLKSGAVKTSFLHSVKEILWSWFYAPYGP